MHHKEATRYLSPRLCAFSINHWWFADAFVEERAKRSETLKPNFKTDVRHAQIVFTEQLLRFLDATVNQVLMWSLIESLPE